MGDYQGVLFDLFGTLVEDEGRAIDGAAALLGALPRERWGIVTSCSRRLALAMLAQASLPMPDHLVSSDDIWANKPAPDGYALGARRLGFAPEDCLAVEDSAPGIMAARSAHLDVVAVLRGRSPEFAHAASFFVERLDQLKIESLDGYLRLG